MSNLARLDAASRALSEARTIIEAKTVGDKAEAIRVFARHAKDRELEIFAAELRLRAERRVGEMLIEIKADGGLDPGGRPSSKPVLRGNRFLKTLAELGVDKKLSMRAQAYAELDLDEFERRLGEWRESEIARADRAVKSLFKTMARPPKPRSPKALPAGTWPVLFADPPWAFETRSESGKDRGPENHYPTMTLDEIGFLEVDRLAAPDCVLLLWVPWVNLQAAFMVIEVWGFEYKTLAFNWVKPTMGLGYWTRSGSEGCLLATRGAPNRVGADVMQVIHAPPGRHSEKPEEAYTRTEALLQGPYLELFARKKRAGWDCWGDEVE